jgi:hypothetical protein
MARDGAGGSGLSRSAPVPGGDGGEISATAATKTSTATPSPSAPGTTVQRMVKDCRDAMRSGNGRRTRTARSRRGRCEQHGRHR